MAHNLQPIFQVGKGGTNEQMINQISEALERRELIKVSILNNNLDNPKEIAEELANGAGAELVQLIGRTIVLYKESREYKQIELP
ncbi:RNA-binding protein YhbY [compost metagenome]